MRTGVVFVAVTGVSSCGLLPWWCARHRFLPAAKDLDDAHGAAAAGAWFAQCECGDVWLCILGICLFRELDAEQRIAAAERARADEAERRETVEADMKELEKELKDQRRTEILE